MKPFAIRMLSKIREIVFLMSSECTRQQVERSKEVSLTEAEADLKFIGIITKIPEWRTDAYESQKTREEADWKRAKWVLGANREKREWRNK